MSLCINPRCLQPDHPGNDVNRFCQSCGSDLTLQGRYRVMRLLNDSSGFGRVYEAYERSTPKLLKVLKEHHNTNPKAIELFEQEAAVLGRLHHPGIPAVEEDGCFQFLPRGEAGLLHCLIMEKIDGPNLSEWMRQQGGHPISESQALDWLQQLADVLHLIHQENYFHRDIKPENIMLRSNGQLVLVDFGAAREMTYTYFAQLGATGGVTRISSAGYTAPEQERGQAVPQSDFYALGCTFVFLLTGKGPSDPSIYDSLNNEFHWRSLAPHISAPLADFIDRLIAPRAADRPANTQELLDELAQLNAILQSGMHSPEPHLVPAQASQGGHVSHTGQGGGTASSRQTSRQTLGTLAPGTQAQASHTQVQSLAKRRLRWEWIAGALGVAIAISGVTVWTFIQNQNERLPSIGREETTDPYRLEATLSGHQGAVNALALSGDQQTLVSGSNDRGIKLWDMAERQELRTLTGHDNSVSALAISPNVQRLASSGGDLYIRVWNMETGAELQTLRGHTKPLNDLVFTSDGERLISASADTTIKIWNLQTGEAGQTLTGHTGYVNAIAIRPDGKTLVSGAADNTIKIWDLETGTEISTLLGHTSFVNDVAISPDGQWLASAGADNTIKIWNMGTWTEVRTLDQHESYVNELLFSPDGRTLISASADQTIKLWTVEDGTLQASIPWPGTFIDAIAVKFEGPSWQVIGAGKGSNDIQIWRLNR